MRVRKVLIRFKDGSQREFVHKPRAGGSYALQVRYEGEMVIVEDEYGATKAYPVTGTQDVTTWPEHYY